ncbi:MAG: hypothetical protein AB8G05_16540 [Oligoflexales bacterium]
MNTIFKKIQYFIIISISLIYSKYAIADSGDTNIRVQQAPFLFLPALADAPLAQIEIMFRPNKHVNMGIIGSSLFQKEEFGQSNYELNISGIGTRIDFVLNDDAFSDGIYVSNQLSLGLWNSTEVNKDQSICSQTFKAGGENLITGGSLGYQWFWGNGYNLSIGMGILESRALTVNTSDNSQCVETVLMKKEFNVIRKNVIDLGFGFSF